MSSPMCQPTHDWFTDFLTTGLIVGLFISYAPQHYRIINKGSSEGFSPWFLLLGSTSGASGMLNMIIMQWEVLSCCRIFSAGDCLETIAGVLQLVAQWFLFSAIFVLYMIYYPPHLKHHTLTLDLHDDRPPQLLKGNTKAPYWRLSIALAWLTFLHLVVCTIVTILLLAWYPAHAAPVRHYATFLGVASGVLAAAQYAPQLAHTYHTRLVGALSIPMMLIQTPGGFVMVLSIALRPGTNWTTWIQFLVAALMQAVLLAMCLAWKVRQTRLCIDDFGHPLPCAHAPAEVLAEAIDVDEDIAEVDENAPLLAKPHDGPRGWRGWFVRK